MAFKPLPEPAAVYEIQLVAYNGNGESIANKRLVSLAESGTNAKAANGGYQSTNFYAETMSTVMSLMVHQGAVK